MKEGGPRQQRGFRERLRGSDAKTAQKARALTVRDAMTTPVVTVSPRASVAEAARRMSDNGVKRLPVVRDGELVEVARVIRDQGKGAIYVASEALGKGGTG